MEPDEQESKEKRRSELAYDLVMDTILVFGTLVSVYLIVDGASDGQLTRQVGRWVQSSVIDPTRKRLAFIRDRDRVLNHATWFTIEGVDERGN